MDFKVLITDVALADLRKIVEFVSEDDPAAAQRLGEKLINSALDLRVMPAKFPFHAKEQGIRKMTVAPYLLFYHCDEAARTVTILHFWHGARRYPEILQ